MALVKASAAADTFPIGLRVLVVDDDPLCLMILERMLRQCSYTVTTCSRASIALSLLRENKDKFDLVISDVYMPDMDGFKLLELIGLELDLPVIMMSANGETSAVMKGITHGACDYLLKPVRIEELRNIWQHVVRKKTRDTFREEHSGEWDESGRPSPVGELEYSSKKRKEKDAGIEEPVEDANSLKKARVVWSIELHQQFVNAVNKLGIDKAVPKRILEIMNVQGLTRENVASHLQKYRLYLKRLSGVNPSPHPVASFQAAGEGSNFGGTLQIQPGGRGLGGGKHGATNLGAGLAASAGISNVTTLSRSSLGNVDSGTLATLAQLQALQQRQSANSSLGPLGTGLGGTSSGTSGLLAATPSIGLSSLQGLSSYDLNMLMQAQQESVSRQRPLGGSSDNLSTLQSLSFLGNAGNAGRVSGGNLGGGPGVGAGGGLAPSSNGGGNLGGGANVGSGGMGMGNSHGGGSTLQLGTGPAVSQSGSPGTGLNEDMHNYGSLQQSGGGFLGQRTGGNQTDMPSALFSQLMNQQRNSRPKFESPFPS